MAERFRRNTQQQLFDTSNLTMRASEPVPAMVAMAKNYTRGAFPDPKSFENVVSKGDQGYVAYKTFEKGQSEPISQEMQDSYKVLRSHLGPQFSQLTSPVSEGGAGLNVEFTDTDPYASYEEMHADVTKNNRLKILNTNSDENYSHDFITPDENNMFRAVHDAMHMTIGRNFDRHGEWATSNAHAAMFPKEAHLALASELRGQNSALVYGGKGFPENRASNLPKWMAEESIRVPDEPRKKVDAEQLRLF